MKQNNNKTSTNFEPTEKKKVKKADYKMLTKEKNCDITKFLFLQKV